jgi:hypothetical protein
MQKQITPVNQSIEFDSKVDMLFEDLTERRELACGVDTHCIGNACVCDSLCGAQCSCFGILV